VIPADGFYEWTGPKAKRQRLWIHPRAGGHHDEPYELQVRYACEDIVALRQQARDLARDIERKLDAHEVGKLLTTIKDIGPLTAACIIGETGDPARFRSAAALASYVGVVPRLRQSGKRRFSGRVAIPLGNARLRRALRMPVLAARLLLAPAPSR